MIKKGSRFFVVYSGLFLFFSLLLFVFLKFIYRHNFGEQKLENILTSRSSWRDITNDPCKFQINGDPVFNESGYLKINLYCQNGEKSLNTISLVALNKALTYQKALEELGRINGFNADLVIKDSKNWSCYVDKTKINLDSDIIRSSTLNCNQAL